MKAQVFEIASTYKLKRRKSGSCIAIADALHEGFINYNEDVASQIDLYLHFWESCHLDKVRTSEFYWIDNNSIEGLDAGTARRVLLKEMALNLREQGFDE